MIGYVDLITTAIIISSIVYQHLKTYIPSEDSKCPDGISIFVAEKTYDCANKQLDLTIKNNGRFNIGGYFISATNSPNQEVATSDLSKYDTTYGKGGAIIQ